jgi:uncharacterized protein (DUF2344 family)
LLEDYFSQYYQTQISIRNFTAQYFNNETYSAIICFDQTEGSSTTIDQSQEIIQSLIKYTSSQVTVSANIPNSIGNTIEKMHEHSYKIVYLKQGIQRSKRHHIKAIKNYPDNLM